MSFYCAKAGIYKIKKKYQKQFGYLFTGDVKKLSGKCKAFYQNWMEDDGFHSPTALCHLKNDMVDEWKGKYPTTYKDGIFTFSYSYNSYYGNIFPDELVDFLKEIGIETDYDFWDEDCDT